MSLPSDCISAGTIPYTLTKYSTDLENRSADFQSFNLYLFKKKESLC